LKEVVMAKKAGYTSDAPEPAGPYSQSVRAGSFVAAAGQVGLNPQTGEIVSGDVREQTRQALENLQAVLAASEATLSDVLRLGVFLTSLEDFAPMNEVFKEVLPEPLPARTTVYVSLPPGLKVEIDAIAVTKDSE
jgi:2-iminobutanoate/2-iminopropanoate deaminase